MSAAVAPPAPNPNDVLNQALDDLNSLAELPGGLGLAQRDSQFEIEGEMLRYLAGGIRAARSLAAICGPRCRNARMTDEPFCSGAAG